MTCKFERRQAVRRWRFLTIVGAVLILPCRIPEPEYEPPPRFSICQYSAFNDRRLGFWDVRLAGDGSLWSEGSLECTCSWEALEHGLRGSTAQLVIFVDKDDCPNNATMQEVIARLTRMTAARGSGSVVLVMGRPEPILILPMGDIAVPRLELNRPMDAP